VEQIQSNESMFDVNTVDKSLMEKLRLMEAMNDEERKTIYTMLDEFIDNLTQLNCKGKGNVNNL
jgi:t-SNARE complex subunit (syntaxin)